VKSVKVAVCLLLPRDVGTPMSVLGAAVRDTDPTTTGGVKPDRDQQLVGLMVPFQRLQAQRPLLVRISMFSFLSRTFAIHKI
jgi:hypothetical protein